MPNINCPYTTYHRCIVYAFIILYFAYNAFWMYLGLSFLVYTFNRSIDCYVNIRVTCNDDVYIGVVVLGTTGVYLINIRFVIQLPIHMIKRKRLTIILSYTQVCHTHLHNKPHDTHIIHIYIQYSQSTTVQ